MKLNIEATERKRGETALTFDSVASAQHETSYEEVSRFFAGPMSKHPVISVKGHPEVIWVRPDLGLGNVSHPVAFAVGQEPQQIPWQETSRSLKDGYLPILVGVWNRGFLKVQQTSFAVLLDADEVVTGHEKQIAVIEIAFSNTSSHERVLEDWWTFVPLLVSARGVPPFPYNTYDLFEVVGELPAVEDSVSCEDNVLRSADLPIGIYRCDEGIRTSAHKTGLQSRIDLRPGETRKLEIFVTSSRDGLTPEQLDYLQTAKLERELARREEDLNSLLSTGMRISVPEEKVNSIYKAQILHSQSQLLQAADRNYRLIAQGFQGVWPWEVMKFTAHWDSLGFHDDVRKCLEYFLEIQGRFPPHGNFKNSDGVFGGTIAFEESGWEQDQSTFYGQLAALNSGKEKQFPNWMNGTGAMLYAFATHYWYTRDSEWLKRVAPALIRACNWIIEERQETKQYEADGRPVLHFGLLPVGRAYDTAEEAMRKLEENGERKSGEADDRLAPLDTYYPCWTDSYSSLGLTEMAAALADIQHADANRLVPEAKAYRDDLLEVMRRTRTADRDLPPYPERLYRPAAWAEFATGSLAYVDTGFMEPRDEPFVQLEQYMKRKWNRGTVGLTGGMEKNGDPYGTNSYYVNFSEDIWHRGWLLRGELEKALLAFYSVLAYGMDRQTLGTVERFHLSDARYAPFYMDTSASARVCGLIRQALILEDGKAIHLLAGVPRRWLSDGQTIQVGQGITRGAKVELFISSHAAEGCIRARVELHQLHAGECEVVLIRVPHPERRQIKEVTINGRVWHDVNHETETVAFRPVAGVTDIQVAY